ncbi:hypothetical protein [Endozoicomonas sp.]|uniref:hypothetical protein n=1 Tax=Endozoicomonas sp. TaxID=1892382 RepID=UPI002885A222|nr:hypothetical protein [Endozoicomonas sp.]
MHPVGDKPVLNRPFSEKKESTTQDLTGSFGSPSMLVKEVGVTGGHLPEPDGSIASSRDLAGSSITPIKSDFDSESKEYVEKVTKIIKETCALTELESGWTYMENMCPGWSGWTQVYLLDNDGMVRADYGLEDGYRSTPYGNQRVQWSKTGVENFESSQKITQEVKASSKFKQVEDIKNWKPSNKLACIIS